MPTIVPRRVRRTYRRLGTVALASAAVIALVAFTAGRGPEPYHVSVRLQTAYGIAPGDPVLISGAPVGKITALRVLSDGTVDAAFTVDQTHRLPLHPKVMVTTQLLGMRQLEIVRPSGSTPEDAAPVAVLRSAQELEADPFEPLERASAKARRDAAATLAIAQAHRAALLHAAAQLQAQRAAFATTAAMARASYARTQAFVRHVQAETAALPAPPTPPPATLAHAQRVEAAFLRLRAARPPRPDLGPQAARDLATARAGFLAAQANAKALLDDLRAIRR